MATTIQHNPVLLQQQPTDDEDVALATYLSSSLRFDQHHQPQQQQQQQQQQQAQGQYNNAAQYYQQQKKLNRPRTRVSSNTSSSSSQIQVQKSTSTPIINNNRTRKPPPPSPSSQASSIDGRRRSVITLNSERRPSIASTTSAMSIQSDMSMNTKLSLTKKLRKVFSMNNLKNQPPTSNLGTLNERNGSITSLSSTVTESAPKQLSFRRRSIASLSSLFQKGETASVNTPSPPVQAQAQAPVSAPAAAKKMTKESNTRRHSSGDLRQLVKEENKKRPELRVDVKKGGLKVRSASNNSSSSNSVTPDSPNSVISSRSSFSRLPPPQQQRNFIHLPETGLPSPTPSTSSSSKVKTIDEDYINNKKPSTLVGFHYGLGLHGSPKLKPASSSTSTLGIETRRIQFCSTIQVHETFAPADYDRRCDTNSTCQKLTHIMAMKIKQELNEYKLTDMEVHVESRQYTHFFL
ncbi:uncharacterized protein EV154DRAFT_491219 [Mucor mucedo]|uniref:uncharacterized protein n=1 Tax=Mucor mucedo TaxID=29922 RepID=UPI00221FC111|nr:uncharacterized protein EV154DRAFT_491219 [Mucor mucedo]KAI7896916.1 hypothetical protein EV154DRAFT_491219 [Mucor mucedo]